MRSFAPLFALALASTLCAGTAHATTVVDATGDFLSTYAGVKDGDLDVTSFTVTYNAAALRFDFGATLAAAINPAVGGRYVIGIYTGNNTTPNNFASIGAGNVLFNQTISVTKFGVTTLGAVTLTPSIISGNSFSGSVLVSQLTSQGFTPEQYGFNLWPRDALSAGTAAISDFAPNNAVILAVPEPATWTMLIAGFGLVAGAARRRAAGRVQTAG